MAFVRNVGAQVLPANHIRYSSHGMGLSTFGLVICDPAQHPDDYAAFSEWGKPYAVTLPHVCKETV